jgi:translation initiation factor 1
VAKKKTAVIDPAPKATLGSLGDLLRTRGVEVTDAAAPPPFVVPKPVQQDGLQLAGAGKIVIRLERKGHGGKTVTVIEGLALGSAALERVARELRKTLGCGSWVDGLRIVLQGDRARGAEAWLRARSATRIVQGN